MSRRESGGAPLRPRSLHGRLILLLVVLLGSVGAFLTFGLTRGSQLFFEEVHARLDAEVAAHIAETIHPNEEGAFDQTQLKGLFMDVMVINPALEVYLLDLAGNVLAYDAPEELILRRAVNLASVERFLGDAEGVVHGDDPRSPDATKPISAAPVLDVEGGERVGYLYVILGGQGYDSVLAPLRQSLVVRTASLLALALVLVTAIVGAFAVGRMTRPLRALSRRIRAFRAEGEPRLTVVSGGDEVAELEAAFDAMSARIRSQVEELEANDERRREFVAGISHDLRTPASALQGYLETLFLRTDRVAPEDRKQYIGLALRQGRRLGRLIDQLFELARIEARQDVRREPFSLAELVQDTVCEFEERAAKRGVSLRAVFPYELPEVYGDISLIQRALDNLIDNAIRYAGDEAEIVVRLAEEAEGVRVRVWNSGQVIPAKEVPHLFERFYRGERPGAESTRGVKGSGLGLAITRRIIDVHDGEITVESTPDEGTTFSFALPPAVPVEV